MVSAANPYAVNTAVRILEKGGSATDAAIAAHLVLGLVEPQSSGLGGGGFILFIVKPQDQSKVRERLKHLIHVSFKFDLEGSRNIVYYPEDN